jgi:hypothetical protein
MDGLLVRFLRCMRCSAALHTSDVRSALIIAVPHQHSCTQATPASTTLTCRNEQEPDGVATCAWDESAIASDDPVFPGKGGKDTGEDFHAAPDLDHTSEVVQAGLSDYSKCVSLRLAAWKEMLLRHDAAPERDQVDCAHVLHSRSFCSRSYTHVSPKHVCAQVPH